MTDAGDRALVDALAATWASTETFAAGLDAGEWRLPTDCPGWSVQDNLAHLVAIESILLGRPAPDHTPTVGPHVRNDMGRSNEVWVDWYRSRSGPEVLDAFREVTGLRRAVLDDPGYDFGAASWTPRGPGTVRQLLPFRIFDGFTHEQDMRRAAGRPGGWETAAAAMTLEAARAAMPMVVGRKVAPADGVTVAFDVHGPVALAFELRMVGGRALEGDGAGAADARLRMSSEAFLRLGAGRGDPDTILASGEAVVEGDQELGARVVRAMNFLF